MDRSPEEHLKDLIARVPSLSAVRAAVYEAFELLCTCFDEGNTLFVCGNGGSAADSEHIVGELLKGFLLPRHLSDTAREELTAVCGQTAGSYLGARLQQGLRAVALTGHPSLATAVSNDTAGDLVFAQQLSVLSRAGDVLLGISTSGNARNVSYAAQVARWRRVKVIGLTGDAGGTLAGHADVVIRVPSDSTPLIQELHVPVYHTLCAMLESRFFGP